MSIPESSTKCCNKIFDLLHKERVNLDTIYLHDKYSQYLTQWFDRRLFDGLHFNVEEKEDNYSNVKTNVVESEQQQVLTKTTNAAQSNTLSFLNNPADSFNGLGSSYIYSNQKSVDSEQFNTYGLYRAYNVIVDDLRNLINTDKAQTSNMLFNITSSTVSYDGDTVLRLPTNSVVLDKLVSVHNPACCCILIQTGNATALYYINIKTNIICNGKVHDDARKIVESTDEQFVVLNESLTRLYFFVSEDIGLKFIATLESFGQYDNYFRDLKKVCFCYIYNCVYVLLITLKQTSCLLVKMQSLKGIKKPLISTLIELDFDDNLSFQNSRITGVTGLLIALLLKDQKSYLNIIKANSTNLQFFSTILSAWKCQRFCFNLFPLVELTDNSLDSAPYISNYNNNIGCSSVCFNNHLLGSINLTLWIVLTTSAKCLNVPKAFLDECYILIKSINSATLPSIYILIEKLYKLVKKEPSNDASVLLLATCLEFYERTC